MTFTLASTTDSQDDVNAAAGIAPDKPKTAEGESGTKPEAKKELESSSGGDESKTGAESEAAQPVGDKKPESEAESGTADAEEDDEELELEDDEEEEEKPEVKKTGAEEPVKKKGKGLSKRIDKLTREKAELSERLARLEGKSEAEKEKAAKTEEKKDPKPVAKDFTEHEDYISSLSRWEARQENKRLKEEDQRQRDEADTREVFDNYNDAANSYAREKYEDWEEVVGKTAEVPQVVANAIIALGKDGTDVAYYLGQHPEICKELMGMSQIKAVARIGRIDARLHPETEEKKTETPPEKKKPPVSKAADPITPIKPTATKSTKPVDEMSHTEYKEWRKKHGRS